MAKAKVKTGLSSLVAPLSAEAFIDSSWPKQPYVVHDLATTISPLTELPFLKSLDSLLNAWPHPIQVHLPDVADEASAIDANAVDAKKLFANGMALLFNNVQRISPVLKQWLKAIHSDLGLPTMTYQRCMVYATPDGKGTAPHFDQNVNFILQLTGTKTWWIAPNRHVENPSQRHTIGLPTDPELAAYLDEPLPRQMPEKAKKVVLKPGSMLFVPQGYWHSTEAKGEALSLNFTFSQPSWVDLFTAALRSRLLLSPEWREMADGVTSKNADRRAIAEQKFDFLLLDLTQDLPNWNAGDILGATENLSDEKN